MRVRSLRELFNVSFGVGRSALGVWMLLALMSWPAQAVVELHEFENEVLRQRYLSFVAELRCPKCQNQNLAGSDSPIASDLRRELRRLLDEGRSDTEIVDFMVHRYGDYVLYKPKLKRNTLVLWGLPLVILLVAFTALVMLVRRRRGVAADEESKVRLSDEQQQRLQALLAKASERNSPR